MYAFKESTRKRGVSRTCACGFVFYVAAGTTLITYDQIVKVVTIGRGVGLWGDMVITLKNGDNVEFRSLPG